MEKTSSILFLGIMTVLTAGILAGLIRAIRGPRRADRILGINVIGSLSTGMLAVLTVYLKESWLLDVCLVYGMISFLSVVVLARILISSAKEQPEGERGSRTAGSGKNREEQNEHEEEDVI